jgi:hypothetical protein
MATHPIADAAIATAIRLRILVLITLTRHATPDQSGRTPRQYRCEAVAAQS